MKYGDSFMDCLYGIVEEPQPDPPHIGLSDEFWKKKTARNRESGGSKYKRKKRAILFKNNWSCYYCGRPEMENSRLTLDHVTPKARGGGNRNENLVAACPDCNQLKAAYTLEQFWNKHPEFLLLRRDLNFENGMNAHEPWCANPYSDLFVTERFWDNYFKGNENRMVMSLQVK